MRSWLRYMRETKRMSEKQVADLVKLIKTMANLSGYEIINRVEFRNRNTGRTYR